MGAQGRKFRAAAATVDRSRAYQIPEAVSLVKGAAFAKFDETVDVAVRLGVDPRRTAVVEDAISGVEAGRRGGFGLVIGVDRGAGRDALVAGGADVVVGDLGEVAA
jgi:ribosomal protein L1